MAFRCGRVDFRKPNKTTAEGHFSSVLHSRRYVPNVTSRLIATADIIEGEREPPEPEHETPFVGEQPPVLEAEIRQGRRLVDRVVVPAEGRFLPPQLGFEIQPPESETEAGRPLLLDARPRSSY